MTENEAIKHLEHIIWCMGDEPPQNIKNDRDIKEWEDEHKKIKKTYEVAIQALEEIQQYRAIGTVEELKTAMLYVSLAKKHGTVGRAIDACAEYESIGTIEEFKALKEKQENGLLLELPCKVGETVYLADRIHYKVKKSIVEHVEYIKNDNSNFPFTKIKGEGFSVFFDDFGKLLFLTEEEAQQALDWQ